MNETVKTILDKIDEIKNLCYEIEIIIDAFRYNCVNYDSCNSVDYKQFKQDIRRTIKDIDNTLEELNAKVFSNQLEKIKTNNSI